MVPDRFSTVPSWCFLCDGTVPSRCFLRDGTVPSRCFLRDCTVPSYNHYHILFQKSEYPWFKYQMAPYYICCLLAGVKGVGL